MHGKINVQSDFGKGSLFIVQIPQKISYIQTRNDVKVQEVKLKSDIDYKNKKILIVDDNRLNIKVAKVALKSFPFIIDDCENGQECLNKIKQGNTYDIILMDIMMPVMSGLTTLQKLKEIEGFNTPVIALTADALSGSEEKYKKEGFNDYIAKPFNKDEIKEKIDKLLKQEKHDRWQNVPSFNIVGNGIEEIK